MWWPLVALALVFIGRPLGRWPRAWGMGMAGLATGAAIFGVHWELREADALLRMVALCCVLLGGVKSVVYCEWCRGGRRHLSWTRYLAFGLGWFGMDPGSFARTRYRGEWKNDLKIGLVCAAVGLGLCLWVRGAGWEAVLLVFVPMSLAFHFGVLRILTAFWRGHGIPVRVLFRNPLQSQGLGDFWSRRWNLGYSEMMVRVVKKPMERIVPRRMAEAAVFLVSGLFHEIAITVPVRDGYGGPTLYFLLHGLAVGLEAGAWPMWWKRVWAVLWLVAPVALLFPDAFVQEVVLRCLRVLPDLGG